MAINGLNVGLRYSYVSKFFSGTPCSKYLSGISASNWLLVSPECVGKVEEEVELVANAEELRLLDRLGAPFATVARRCWSSPWVWS